jgi:hypothetical protein
MLSTLEMLFSGQTFLGLSSCTIHKYKLSEHLILKYQLEASTQAIDFLGGRDTRVCVLQGGRCIYGIIGLQSECMYSM